MKYRKLGNTGMEVSVLSFGASSLGGVFHPVNLDDCIETVRATLDGGINLIDVSPSSEAAEGHVFLSAEGAKGLQPGLTGPGIR